MKSLVLGHVTVDILKAGERLGGAIYAAKVLSTATKVTLITSVPESLVQKIKNECKTRILNIPGEKPTSFRISWEEGRRKLEVISIAEKIPQEVVGDISGFDLVVALPVIGELDGILGLIAGPKSSVDIQGLVRKPSIGEIGLYRRDPLELKGFAVAHGSREEISMLGGVEELRKVVGTLIVTDGAKGGVMISGDSEVRIPESGFNAVDDTGAGDVLLASFSYYRIFLPARRALEKALSYTWEFLRTRKMPRLRG